MNDILDLLEYHRWATEKVLQIVATLPPEYYSKDLGSSFPSIQSTLVHCYSADRAWLGRIHGQRLEPLSPADYPSITSLREVWLETLSIWLTVLQQLEEPKQIISYHAYNGTAYHNKLSDIVRHVVNHSTYHRGQVTTMLRQLGAEGVTTDLIAYYRLKT
ncbi:MAG: DinB family protein [Trueperaceae bacterium]